MKKSTGIFLTLFLTISLALGMGACASKEKAASGPAAEPAPEVKAPAAAQPMAQGTVEVQPAAQDMKRQQEEEAERQKRAELDKVKLEEATKAAAAAALAPEKLEKVYFDFDKYEVKPDFRAPLERDAASIKDHPDAKVVVEGHCDERGTEEYNLALGERRAMSVKTFLVSLGVKDGQLYTISYGEERPVDNGHDEKAWSQNRRVQFSQE